MRYFKSIQNVIIAIILSLVSSNALSQVDVTLDVGVAIYPNRVEVAAIGLNTSVPHG